MAFSHWWLFDVDCTFFESLLKIDLRNLPDKVDRGDFQYWKNSNCSVSKVIEPRITFAGKGYKSGFSGGSGNHTPYSGINYIKHCESAIKLLGSCLIQSEIFERIPWTLLTHEDFVYLDPPYHQTCANYNNINHEYLLQEILLPAKFRWALSGYETDLYRDLLGWCDKVTKIRNSEIKSHTKGQFVPVQECLWRNWI